MSDPEIDQLKTDVAILKKAAHFHDVATLSDGHDNTTYFGPPQHIYVEPEDKGPDGCVAELAKIIPGTIPNAVAIKILKEIRGRYRWYLSVQINELEKDWRNTALSQGTEIMELRERLRQSESARDAGERSISDLITQRDHVKSQLCYVNDENLKFRGALRAIANHTTVCVDFTRAEDCQNIAKNVLAPV